MKPAFTTMSNLEMGISEAGERIAMERLWILQEPGCIPESVQAMMDGLPKSPHVSSASDDSCSLSYPEARTLRIFDGFIEGMEKRIL